MSFTPSQRRGDGEDGPLQSATHFSTVILCWSRPERKIKVESDPSLKQPELTKGLNSSRHGGSSTFHACESGTRARLTAAATADRILEKRGGNEVRQWAQQDRNKTKSEATEYENTGSSPSWREARMEGEGQRSESKRARKTRFIYRWIPINLSTPRLVLAAEAAPAGDSHRLVSGTAQAVS